MLATGSIMKWFSLFPIDWRTGATFVHDWFALGIWVAVIGHVMFAFKDPVALGGMMRGYGQRGLGPEGTPPLVRDRDACAGNRPGARRPPSVESAHGSDS